MSVNSAMLEAMQAEGLDLDACIRIIKASELKADPTNAQRQARHRAKRKAESNGVTVTPVTPPNERDNLTPREMKNTDPKGSCKNPVWTCPAGVNPVHWRDFLKNRKTKHLTNSETAYRGQLRELEKLADDEWPPGRLVQHAAEKGWGSINDPRTSRNGQSSSNITSLRGHRPDPALDLLRAASAAEDRENRWGVGPSVPAIGSS